MSKPWNIINPMKSISLLRLLPWLLSAMSCLAMAESNKHLLVGYDFDDKLAEVGPDTYQIFKYSFGKVGLSSAYKFSGNRALKIQDVADDGGFPELQGFFKTIKTGRLFFHFAMLVADTAENFNIALAGKSHFRLVKHGIGFWLDNENGRLRHYIDHKPQELFSLTPFLWYEVDLSYDIDRGSYDLRIRDEYGAQLVNLKNQANAVRLPGSTVNKFSFIGDLPDQQNASYYVDDVMIYTQDKLVQEDLVAPGRRKLFVDAWDDYHRKLYGKIQCIPGLKISDFGIGTDSFFELVKQGQHDLLNNLLENNIPEIESWPGNHLLSAIYHWQKGCNLLRQKNWQQAIDYFRVSGNLVGNARIYPLSLALAYAGAGQFQQADNILAVIQSDWTNDQRLAVANAMIGFSRNYTHTATEWLASLALETYQPELMDIIEPLHAGHIDQNMITRLKSYAPQDWPQFLQQAVITEQYYFALLWEKSHYDAFLYATKVIEKLQKLNIESSKWRERAADAAFYGGDYSKAANYYQSALEVDGSCYCNYLKLADIYHITGEVQLEREYRQRVYGKFDDID